MDHYILTYSGKRFYYGDIERNDRVELRDVVEHLAKICRFAGACERFYSVAQHSVHVSHLVPPEDAREGLLHDASEAYLCDLPHPLKKFLPDYRAIQERVESLLAVRFSLRHPFPASVHRADMIMLATERRDLLPRYDGGHWPALDGVKPARWKIEPLSPDEARYRFFRRCQELGVE